MLPERIMLPTAISLEPLHGVVRGFANIALAAPRICSSPLKHSHLLSIGYVILNCWIVLT